MMEVQFAENVDLWFMDEGLSKIKEKKKTDNTKKTIRKVSLILLNEIVSHTLHPL